MVSRARRLLGTKKVGHAGTLDPMATGVLVLGVGRATKLLGYVSGDSKTYEATIRLGIGTVTEDAEGEVEETPGMRVVGASGATTSAMSDAPEADLYSIDGAIAEFVGIIQQVPSAVSAIKVDGKRAYALVRAGEDVQLKARTVEVSSFERIGDVRSAEVDGTPVVDIDVVVDCSSGTYIRALARDLGQRLGTAAHLTALRRTRVGSFGLDVAKTLDQLQELVDAGEKPNLIPLATAVREQFPLIVVSDAATRAFANGRPIELSDVVNAEPDAIAKENDDDAEESPIVAFVSQSDPEDPVALVRFEGGKFRSVLHLHV